MSKSPRLQVNDKTAKIARMLRLLDKLNIIKEFEIRRWATKQIQGIGCLSNLCRPGDFVEKTDKWEYEIIR